MQIKEKDFEIQIKNALNTQFTMGVEFEANLFAEANNLLSVKRERHRLHELKAQRANLRKQRDFNIIYKKYLNKISLLFWKYLLVRPHALATAATFATFFLAFMAMHPRQEQSMRLSYSDLPALPDNNDFPARYDEQLLAERQAYEREVESDHQKTNGGN